MPDRKTSQKVSNLRNIFILYDNAWSEIIFAGNKDSEKSRILVTKVTQTLLNHSHAVDEIKTDVRSLENEVESLHSMGKSWNPRRIISTKVSKLIDIIELYFNARRAQKSTAPYENGDKTHIFITKVRPLYEEYFRVHTEVYNDVRLLEDEVESLKMSLQTSRETSHDVESLNTSLQKTRETSDEVKSLKQSLKESQEASKDFERLYNSLRQKIENKDWNFDFSRFKLVVENFEKRIADMLKQINKLEHKLRDAEEAETSFASEYTSQVNQYLAQKEEAVQRATRLEDEMQRAQKQISSLEDALRDAQNEFTQVSDECNRQAEQYQDQAKAVTQRAQQSEAEVQTLRQEIRRMEHEASNRDTVQVQQCMAQRDSISKQVTELEAVKDNLQKDIHKLQLQIKAAEDELQLALAECQSQAQGFETTEMELEAAVHRAEQLEAQIQRHQGVVESLERDLQHAHEENQQLMMQLEDYKRKLQQRPKVDTGAVEELRNEASQMASNLLDARKLIENTNKQLALKTRQFDIEEEKARALKSELDEMQQKNKDMVRQISTCQNDVSRIQKHVQEADADGVACTTENARLMQVTRQLSQRLEKLEASTRAIKKPRPLRSTGNTEFSAKGEGPVSFEMLPRRRGSTSGPPTTRSASRRSSGNAGTNSSSGNPLSNGKLKLSNGKKEETNSNEFIPSSIGYIPDPIANSNHSKQR